MQQAAHTAYVHTRLIKVTCTRTLRVLPEEGFTDTESIPSFTYSMLRLTPPQCLDDK